LANATNAGCSFSHNVPSPDLVDSHRYPRSLNQVARTRWAPSGMNPRRRLLAHPDCSGLAVYPRPSARCCQGKVETSRLQIDRHASRENLAQRALRCLLSAARQFAPTQSSSLLFTPVKWVRKKRGSHTSWHRIKISKGAAIQAQFVSCSRTDADRPATVGRLEHPEVASLPEKLPGKLHGSRAGLDVGNQALVQTGISNEVGWACRSEGRKGSQAPSAAFHSSDIVDFRFPNFPVLN
jgi:hypothetical protein